MIRFDSSSAQQQLMQKEAALKQAQATLDQAVAQARDHRAAGHSNLADAKFTVERARLEVSKQAIVSRIEGEAEQDRSAAGRAKAESAGGHGRSCTPRPTKPRSPR